LFNERKEFGNLAPEELAEWRKRMEELAKRNAKNRGAEVKIELPAPIRFVEIYI